MKTNKINNILIALLAVVLLASFTVTAFADTQAVSVPAEEQDKTALVKGEKSCWKSTDAESRGHKPGKKGGNGYKKSAGADWLEDWFEDRIEARARYVDFSTLPENPTDDEVMEFFKNNFLGEAPAKSETTVNKDKNTSADTGKSRSERSEKTENVKADRYEDYFEDRIEARSFDVDFSTLPENPTNEEILEFFKTNFLSDPAK